MEVYAEAFTLGPPPAYTSQARPIDRSAVPTPRAPPTLCVCMCVRGSVASALVERVGFHLGEGIGNPGVSQPNALHAYSCIKSTRLSGEIAGRVSKSITHEDVSTHLHHYKFAHLIVCVMEDIQKDGLQDTTLSETCVPVTHFSNMRASVTKCTLPLPGHNRPQYAAQCGH